MVNLPIKYSDKQVASFGGMNLMERFLDHTKISKFLGALKMSKMFEYEVRVADLFR